MLKLRDMALDTDEFERLLQSEIQFTEETAEDCEQELNRIQGEYLEEFLFDWAEYDRQRYQLQWIRLKLKLADWYYDQKKYEKAFQICDSLCSRYPLEERAQLMYLKICDKLGHHFLVQQQYRLYKSKLEYEYHETPGAEIAQWYHSWKKKQGKE